MKWLDHAKSAVRLVAMASSRPDREKIEPPIGSLGPAQNTAPKSRNNGSATYRQTRADLIEARAKRKAGNTDKATAKRYRDVHRIFAKGRFSDA